MQNRLERQVSGIFFIEGTLCLGMFGCSCLRPAAAGGMPPPLVRGLREFELPGSGRLVQGGADAVRCFYKEPGTVIVNCARRTGAASVEVRGEVDIFWLPMTEANMEEACNRYLNEYGQTLLAAWLHAWLHSRRWTVLSKRIKFSCAVHVV